MQVSLVDTFTHGKARLNTAKLFLDEQVKLGQKQVKSVAEFAKKIAKIELGSSLLLYDDVWAKWVEVERSQLEWHSKIENMLLAEVAAFETGLKLITANSEYKACELEMAKLQKTYLQKLQKHEKVQLKKNTTEEEQRSARIPYEVAVSDMQNFLLSNASIIKTFEKERISLFQKLLSNSVKAYEQLFLERLDAIRNFGKILDETNTNELVDGVLGTVFGSVERVKSTSQLPQLAETERDGVKNNNQEAKNKVGTSDHVLGMEAHGEPPAALNTPRDTEKTDIPVKAATEESPKLPQEESSALETKEINESLSKKVLESSPAEASKVTEPTPEDQLVALKSESSAASNNINPNKTDSNEAIQSKSQLADVSNIQNPKDASTSEALSNAHESPEKGQLKKKVSLVVLEKPLDTEDNNDELIQSMNFLSKSLKISGATSKLPRRNTLSKKPSETSPILATANSLENDDADKSSSNIASAIQEENVSRSINNAFDNSLPANSDPNEAQTNAVPVSPNKSEENNDSIVVAENEKIVCNEKCSISSDNVFEKQSSGLGGEALTSKDEDIAAQGSSNSVVESKTPNIWNQLGDSIAEKQDIEQTPPKKNAIVPDNLDACIENQSSIDVKPSELNDSPNHNINEEILTVSSDMTVPSLADVPQDSEANPYVNKTDILHVNVTVSETVNALFVQEKLNPDKFIVIGQVFFSVDGTSVPVDKDYTFSVSVEDEHFTLPEKWIANPTIVEKKGDSGNQFRLKIPIVQSMPLPVAKYARSALSCAPFSICLYPKVYSEESIFRVAICISGERVDLVDISDLQLFYDQSIEALDVSVDSHAVPEIVHQRASRSISLKFSTSTAMSAETAMARFSYLSNELIPEGARLVVVEIRCANLNEAKLPGLTLISSFKGKEGLLLGPKPVFTSDSIVFDSISYTFQSGKYGYQS